MLWCEVFGDETGRSPPVAMVPCSGISLGTTTETCISFVSGEYQKKCPGVAESNRSHSALAGFFTVCYALECNVIEDDRLYSG
jgi:hypothetical protein